MENDFFFVFSLSFGVVDVILIFFFTVCLFISSLIPGNIICDILRWYNVRQEWYGNKSMDMSENEENEYYKTFTWILPSSLWILCVCFSVSVMYVLRNEYLVHAYRIWMTWDKNNEIKFSKWRDETRRRHSEYIRICIFRNDTIFVIRRQKLL